MIAIKQKLSSRKLTTKHNNIEHLFVQVTTPLEKIIFGTAYLPPLSDPQTYRNHCEDIEKISSKYSHSKIVILGDYNLPNLTWKAKNCGLITNESENDSAREVLDMVNFLNFHQHNFIYNSNNRLLDLALSNYPKISVELSNDPLLPIDNHHPPLYIKLNITCEVEKIPVQKVLNFKRADFDSINSHLSNTDWSF